MGIFIIFALKIVKSFGLNNYTVRLGGYIITTSLDRHLLALPKVHTELG